MEFQASCLPFCPIGSFSFDLVEESLQVRDPLWKVALKGGTVKRGVGVGDACLPAHFSRRPAAMVLVWNGHVF